MKRKLLATLTLLAVVAAACGGGTTTLTEESVGAAADSVDTQPTVASTQAVEPTAEPVATAVPAPDVTPVPEPTTEPPAEAEFFGWAEGRDIGDCFDNIGGEDEDSVAGDPVDCQGEHQNEIFAMFDLANGPGDPYPFDADFYDGLFVEFCDPATIEYGGAPWDEVPFGVAVWAPSEEQWARGDRVIACAAQAGLPNENEFKIGTAAGGDLDSAEGIVARSTVSGQRDFYFSFEGSSLYPLTTGDWELDNTTPDALATGFLFAAPLQDADAPGATAYNYSYEQGEITELDTGLPDSWQIASPHFAIDVPAFVFAARATEEDDWDIYSSTSSAGALPITDNPEDDRWPTLTPDGTQIVYSSSGDIYIVDLDGTNNRQLTDLPGGEFESAVSPDGSEIVFTSDTDGNDDIWLMNIDGSSQRNLSNHPANEAWPFFSADGETIYFQTDRLGVRANLMMMEPSGNNQSYFSYEFMTNAALLPDAVTQRWATELVALGGAPAEPAAEGVVPGDPGETAAIEHSSGRLVATLPAGWQFTELPTDQVASMLATPNREAFDATWDADGAMFTLVDAPEPNDFTELLDGVAVANDSGCDFDGESNDITGARLTRTRRYTCGEGNAIVVGVYESEAGIGLVFEGQWDSDPDFDTDLEMISLIGRNLKWG